MKIIITIMAENDKNLGDQYSKELKELVERWWKDGGKIKVIKNYKKVVDKQAGVL